MKLIPGSFTKRALMVSLIAGSGILAASSFAMTAGGLPARMAAMPDRARKSTPSGKRGEPSICPS